MRFSIAAVFACLYSLSVSGQETAPLIQFEQGKEYHFELQVKTKIAQQAMGQAIDFAVDATGNHRFTVTNATDENTTLHHDVQRLRFSFDGMGQQRAFDSNEEKDMNGPFGKYAQDILSKKYDMIIGPQGQTLMAIPATISLEEMDARLAIIHTMLKDVVSMIYPPGKDEPSAFQVFPPEPLKVGLTWGRSVRDSSVNLAEVYKIEEIHDSAGMRTIIIDYRAESVTISKAQMMGNETITTLNNKSTGKIFVNGLTGLVREKNIITESNGNSQAAFGTVPMTVHTELVLKVSPGSD
jgi:hypothetical protein